MSLFSARTAYAYAPDGGISTNDLPLASASNGPLTACVYACADKTKTLACVSFNDFQRCLLEVLQCFGIASSQKDALAEFCLACGEGMARCAPPAPAAASAPPESTPPKPGPTQTAKPLTPEQNEEALCKHKGGVWYIEVFEGDVSMTTHCVTLINVVDRVVKLERALRMKNAGTAEITPEQLKVLDRLRAMNLPPDLAQRLQNLEGAIEALCEKLKDKPDATLRERCLRINARLATVEIKAGGAAADAKLAFEQSQLALKGVNEAKAQKASEGDPRPKLRLSLVGSLHLHQTPYTQDTIAALGFEGAYTPLLTRDMRMLLLAGIGKSTGQVFGADRVTTWAGVGLTGPIAASDFNAEGFGYWEHWYGANELSALNFYGAGAGVNWMPGSSTRKDFSIVPVIGLRAMLGDTRTGFRINGVHDQLDAVLSMYGSIAF